MPELEANVIIVGSGAAGTWAAHEVSRHLEGTLVLDVGNRPAEQPTLRGSLLDLRLKDPRQADYLIGPDYESLHNVAREYLSPKLKAPRFRFVLEDSERLSPIVTDGFKVVQSLAFGGLATAWGAGVYRYREEDLSGFPIGVPDLEPFYDELTESIGIAGADDDLTPYFGGTRGLQPAHPTSRLAGRLLRYYERRRSRFRESGFTVGRPRLAVLSRDLGERSRCPYDHLTFWEPRLDYLYTPALTMQGLISSGRVRYEGRRLVTAYREETERVFVDTVNVDTGESVRYSGRRLILAAGALNSARLVLKSAGDREARLPLLDNLVTMIPFVHLPSIGSRLDDSSPGLGQLNVVYRGELADETLQATVYSFQSLLASEVIGDFPFVLRGSRAACKYVLPAMMLMTFFYPDRPDPMNYLALGDDGALIARYRNTPGFGGVERRMVGLLRAGGFLSHPKLVRPYPPGNGIHYAGTLPMTIGEGGAYTLTEEGRLRRGRKVFVADAASFPRLSAKNHTFTIMANAMRIGRRVAKDLESGT